MAKRTVQPRFDAETIRACGEVLRFAIEARPLPASALASRISPSIDRRDIARTVRAAFDELSPRQREIVIRCEIRCEPYAAVAKSLHLSERHLYRERRAALSRIAHRLLTHEPAKPSITIAPDAFDARVALSEALENAGNWRAAAQTLERLSGDVVAERRGAVEVRLARLYRDADQFTQAYHHANLANALAEEATSDRDLTRVEANIALAGVAMAGGNWNLSDALAQQSIDRLRPWIDGSFGARVPTALAQALLLKAELLADNGGGDQALRLASEACSIVDRNATDPSTEISSHAMVAVMSSLLGKDAQRSEELLRDCYSAALAAGLIRGSLIIATHLSTHYRLGGRPADAALLLAPLVDSARIAGTGWVRAGVLGALVSANFEAGALAAAAAYTVELSEYSTGNPLTLALQEMSRARLALARQAFKPALEGAAASHAVYANIGLGRYVGLSLLIQAEALCGLGESELAQRSIAQALDVLKATSHPRPLANAYRLMARITGRSQYAGIARKLFREIDASPRHSEERVP
jgi:hypothetical protein